MMSGETPLLAMEYKYNPRKVLSFVATAEARRTTLGITYLMKHPDHFFNISIHPVDFPLLISMFFG